MKHNRSIGLVRSVIVTEPQALKVIYVETDALLFSIIEKNSSEWIVMLLVIISLNSIFQRTWYDLGRFLFPFNFT